MASPLVHFSLIPKLSLFDCKILLHNMVTEVNNQNTQFVSGRKAPTRWESFAIFSIENAQVKVQEYLDRQIDFIYGKRVNWKMQSYISSREAQLHVNASSLPSLTVKKRNVIFPVAFPSRSKTQQSTPPFIWIESLLWNLIKTMELDAPCRGLKASEFKAMVIEVAIMFQNQSLSQFGKKEYQSLKNILIHQSKKLVQAARRFKNRDDKRIEIVMSCSNLLVLLYQLRFDQLKFQNQQRSSPVNQAGQKDTSRLQDYDQQSEISQEVNKHTNESDTDNKVNDPAPSEKEEIILSRSEAVLRTSSHSHDNNQMSFELAQRMVREIHRLNDIATDQKYKDLRYSFAWTADKKADTILEKFDFMKQLLDSFHFPYMGSRHQRVRNFWQVIRAFDGGGIYSASVTNILFHDADTDSEPIITRQSYCYLKEKYFELKREMEEQLDLEKRLHQL